MIKGGRQKSGVNLSGDIFDKEKKRWLSIVVGCFNTRPRHMGKKGGKELRKDRNST